MSNVPEPVTTTLLPTWLMLIVAELEGGGSAAIAGAVETAKATVRTPESRAGRRWNDPPRFSSSLSPGRYFREGPRPDAS